MIYIVRGPKSMPIGCGAMFDHVSARVNEGCKRNKQKNAAKDVKERDSIATLV